MQFYETLPETQKESYRKFIGIIGSLSRLFSENNSPYFDSRIAENIFCKCFKAENLARDDSTADAKIGNIGIGIKTWVGDSGAQKIAEFNKSKNEYGHLNGLEKVKKIAELRKARIDFTLRQYGLSKMIYHVTIREPGFIKILECPLEKIDIPQSGISRIEKGETDVQLSTLLNYLSPLGLTLTVTSKYHPNKKTIDAMNEKDSDESYLSVEELKRVWVYNLFATLKLPLW